MGAWTGSLKIDGDRSSVELTRAKQLDVKREEWITLDRAQLFVTNPNDSDDYGSVNLTATEARQLAAALVALANEIEGRR